MISDWPARPTAQIEWRICHNPLASFSPVYTNLIMILIRLR